MLTDRRNPILLVEDDEALRRVFRDILVDAGYSVMEAPGGNEAYALYQQNRFSAVISDLRMPDGDGMTLLKRVRSSNQPDTAFFLMTGNSHVGAVELVESGATGIIRKPFDIEGFMRTLEVAIR